REASVRAGKDPARIQVVSEHWLCLDDDPARAEAKAMPTMNFLSSYLRSNREGEAGRVGQVPERHFFGNPEMVGQKVLRYQEAGADHIILRTVARDFDEALECLHRFKEEAMDRLTTATAAA